MESLPVLDTLVIQDVCTLGMFSGAPTFQSVFGVMPNRPLLFIHFYVNGLLYFGPQSAPLANHPICDEMVIFGEHPCHLLRNRFGVTQSGF